MSTQEETNTIWKNVWNESSAEPDIKGIFNNRLFIEGYPRIMRLIPDDAIRILEVGGGTGRYGFSLAQDFPGATVVLTDILDESLILMRKIQENLNLSNIEIKQADARKLPFTDGLFDVVFSDVVIQHIPEYNQALAEMKRVVKPGGLIIISVVNVWNPHTIVKMIKRVSIGGYEYGYEHSFTRPELRKLFRQQGLVICEEDGFYFAYGIYRLKYIYPIFSFLGKALNRVSKMIDRFTCRAWSKMFGFEIIEVGRKIT